MSFLTFFTSFLHTFTFCFYAHPLHVSVTEIDYDQKDQALEIMMRVFIDDLETCLRAELNQPELDILNPIKGTTTDDLARDYLAKHFKVSLDGKLQKTVYLGHEREGDAFIFYIQVSDVKKWTTIFVQNDIFMATYDDQSNLVHVYIGEKVKSLRLTRNTPSDKLTFD